MSVLFLIFWLFIMAFIFGAMVMFNLIKFAFGLIGFIIFGSIFVFMFNSHVAIIILLIAILIGVTRKGV